MSDTAGAANPLLSIEFPIPFTRVTPADIEPAVAQLIEKTRRELDLLEDFSGDLTFDATVGAFDRTGEELGRAMTVVGHLEGVVTTPELRAAYNRVVGPVSEFYATILRRQKLYELFLRYAETPEGKGLSGSRRRFLDRLLEKFTREGAGLDDVEKNRLSEIDARLSEATNAFSQHVVDARGAFELYVEDETELEGVPDGVKSQARRSAEAQGRDGWRLTLDAPCLIGVLSHGKNRSLREALYRASAALATREPYDNRGLVAEIISLRKERATILGFPTHAEFVTSDRMVGGAARAREFLASLETRARDPFTREFEQLQAFVKRQYPDAPQIAPWDERFYRERQRETECHFQEEALRPYLPLSQVLTGFFEIATRLFGIRSREVTHLDVWHPDVRAIEFTDADGVLLGYVYMDLLAREGKHGGAWMNSFIHGSPRGKVSTPHVGLIAANFLRPAEGAEVCLLHSELCTFFHEFGHLLHHLFSEVELSMFGGTNVAWDFVELPSQLLENWCWEKEALDLCARHVETGRPIEQSMIDALQKVRRFGSGHKIIRQVGFATVDMLLHSEYQPERDADPVTYGERMLQRYVATPLPAENAFLASFTHLFGGSIAYSAGYYSYHFSEVLDADVYSQFVSAGIFNTEVGMNLRRQILSKGDSADPRDLYRAFMKRDPDSHAFFARAGLA